MLSIDTTIMRELTAASASANNAITEAVEALNRISSHNDWECKEKNAINEYTNTNKNRIRQLQENAAAFLTAITGATNDFETTETSISDMFSSVESMISSLLTIAPSITGVINSAVPTNISSGAKLPTGFSKLAQEVLKNSMPKICQNGCLFKTYAANNITAPIAMCNFSDIDLG